MNDDQQPDDVTERTTRLLDGFRGFGANYTEFTNRFAAWLDLHTTDAFALIEILVAEERGIALTPTKLSTRLSLTTGATANLLNRLEKLGHVVRTREHADRRVVTLHSSPKVAQRAKEFLDPFTKHVEALVAHYPPEHVELFEKFLDDLRATMYALLAERPPG
ncbi:MarR family winged helix-turn-helix transcriptional regulator [Actinokineospora enzanensis]|uniref:MarR family winged helix-turn-helix transcriptional regulator n=1 Tax=Actinokineospora enzanensis TaxID=155975 RepID=UPI000376C013|nr:MarR family transcriptional regulator [Actinokineospora enzanensis]